MNPVTQVTACSLKSAEDGQQVCRISNDFLLQQPGCLRVRWGVVKEDPTKARLLVDWEDMSRHERFRASPLHAEYINQLKPFMAGPAEHFHAKFDPTPAPVLNNQGPESKTPLVEMLYLHFPHDDDASVTPGLKEQATRSVEKFLVACLPVAATMGATGETAIGWSVEEKVDFKGEACRVLAVLAGWESLEAHGGFQGSETFAKNKPLLQGIPGLKGVAVVHASFVTTERKG